DHSFKELPDRLRIPLVSKLRGLLGLDASERFSYHGLEERFEQGGLLRALGVPFSVWIYHGKRWRRLALGSALLSIIVMAGAVTAFSFRLDDLITGQASNFVGPLPFKDWMVIN